MDDQNDDKPPPGEAAGGDGKPDLERLRRFVDAHRNDPPTVEGGVGSDAAGRIEQITAEYLAMLKGGEVSGDLESTAGDPPPKKKTIRSTRTKFRPGVLRVKEYPITEDTLANIGTLRMSAAFWCAIGSLFLGFGLSALTSLLMAGEAVGSGAKEVWIAVIIMTGVVAVISYLAGWFYFSKGQSVIQFVKDNTVHDPLDE